MTGFCPKCNQYGHELIFKKFKEIEIIQERCIFCGEFRDYYDERIDNINLDNTIIIWEEY